jgi:hypothetical protein
MRLSRPSWAVEPGPGIGRRAGAALFGKSAAASHLYVRTTSFGPGDAPIDSEAPAREHRHCRLERGSSCADCSRPCLSAPLLLWRQSIPLRQRLVRLPLLNASAGPKVDSSTVLDTATTASLSPRSPRATLGLLANSASMRAECSSSSGSTAAPSGRCRGEAGAFTGGAAAERPRTS